ncbi:MAG: YCF48-related protein [Bacteroidota bacterium]
MTANSNNPAVVTDERLVAKMGWLKAIPFLLGANRLMVGGLLLTACILTGCQKTETVALAWQQLPSGTDVKLNDVYFADSLNGQVVGGSTWFSGVQLQTNDGGQRWSLDSIAPAELNALDGSEPGFLLTTGIGGQLLAYQSRQGWGVAKLIPTAIHRDLAFNGPDRGVVVSGEAFQDGLILTYGRDFELLSQDTFDNELNAVCFSDDSTVHVVGYGLVLRSADGGLSWSARQIDGDFFQSVCFPSANVGYAVGLFGTIIKTVDAGQTWTKQRDGRKLGVSDVPFRSVFFVDEQKGYIVGDDQAFWRTENGGINWKAVKNPPPGDLQAVYVVDGKGFIVGSEGGIFTFND